MLKLYLIRHGQTPGNKLSRYIGTTDEPLSDEGREFLKKISYPMPEELFVSPLLRCVETAEIFFPGKKLRKKSMINSKIMYLNFTENIKNFLIYMKSSLLQIRKESSPIQKICS